MKAGSIHRVPLHQQVTKRLRAHVTRETAPGQRLDSETALATRFCVSVRTIREALSALAHEGLVERKHGSGTYASQRRPTQHVALWMATDQQFPQVSYWSASVLSQVQALLTRERVPARLYWSCIRAANPVPDLAAKQLLVDLEQNTISAVGVLQGTFPDAALAVQQRKDIPLVWNTHTAKNGEYGVGVNLVEFIHEATRYLLEQGCRKIALMGWLDSRTLAWEKTDWFTAFQTQLTAAGVSTRREWMRGDLHPTQMGAGYEEFREIWSAGAEKPDGLLVTDDVLFQDVVTAILELGIRVPEQIKVVATANQGAVTCPFFPAARVEFDPAAQATAMGEMLVKLAANHPAEPRQIQVPFRWLERTAPVSKREFEVTTQN